MAEFKVDAIEYQSDKIDAMTQWHVLRRLAPVMTGLQDMAAIAANPQAMNISALEPLMIAISKMPDADSNYVFSECLKRVRRKTGAGWMPVWNASANRPQFEDIELPGMLQIVFLVLQETFARFFPESLSA